MSIVIVFLQKIGNLILSILRVFRRAFCCRRRQYDSEMVLPLTVRTKNVEWELWDESGETFQDAPTDTAAVNIEYKKPCHEVEVKDSLNTDGDEDFFKDMVPQYRKPKKLILKSEVPNRPVRYSLFAVDSKAAREPEPGLGVLVDNPTNWEVCEDLEGPIDADSLIKEKRLAEREKRIAEHQRRKLEMENRRSSKQAIQSVHLIGTKNNTKYS